MGNAKGDKTQQLGKTISMLQSRYGPRAVQPARDLPAPALHPHVPTGFARLDDITGCEGVPIGAITLFTGPTTSGKLTLAYKVLANAQQRSALRQSILRSAQDD